MGAEAWTEILHRYGRPARLFVEQPVADREADLVRGSLGRGRAHDLTVFAFHPRGHLAVIRKPFFPPGAYRAPSGGARPGEPPDAAAVREMEEELGITVRLHRYVLRVDARFVAGPQVLAWTTHVFTARAPEAELRPRDVHEIAEACWCPADQLAGPIRRTLLAAGTGLFRYRVALTDAVLALLERHPELRPAP